MKFDGGSVENNTIKRQSLGKISANSINRANGKLFAIQNMAWRFLYMNPACIRLAISCTEQQLCTCSKIAASYEYFERLALLLEQNTVIGYEIFPRLWRDKPLYPDSPFISYCKVHRGTWPRRPWIVLKTSSTGPQKIRTLFLNRDDERSQSLTGWVSLWVYYPAPVPQSPRFSRGRHFNLVGHCFRAGKPSRWTVRLPIPVVPIRF